VPFRVGCLVVLLSCLIILPCLGSLPTSIGISSVGKIRYSNLTRLHIDGRYIKNEYGQIVYLTGVSFPDIGDDHTLFEGEGLGWSSTETERLEARIQRIMALGIPFVRVHISLSCVEPGNEVILKRLDYMSQRFYEEGIYMLMDFHYGSTGQDWWSELGEQELMDDHNAIIGPGWTTGYLDACKIIAARYKDNPAVVGYQNWAEPAWGAYPHDYSVYPELFAAWRDFNIAVNDAILSVSPDSLFVVMNPGYYDFKEVHPLWIQYPMPQDNVIYGCQRYLAYGLKSSPPYSTLQQHYVDGNYEAGKTAVEEYLKRYYFDFLQYNIGPVMNTEFGFYHNLSMTEEARIAQDWYDLHKQYNAHWIHFAWCGSPEGGSGSHWGILDSVAGWDPSINYFPLVASGELMVQNVEPLPAPPEGE